MFFLMSGFVVSFNYEEKLRSIHIKTGVYLGLRILRIYPLYLLATLIGIFIKTRGGMDFFPVSLVGKSIFLIPSFKETAPFPYDFPAWSLSVEMAMSIIYGFALSRASTKTLIGFMSLSGISLLALIADHGSVDLGPRPDQFGEGLVRIAFSFSVGVLIYRQLPRLAGLIPSLNSLHSLIILLVTAFLLLAPIKERGNDGTHSMMPLIYSILCVYIAFPAILMFAARCEPANALGKIHTFLGSLSYPLYVLHVPLSKLIALLLIICLPIDLKQISPATGIILLLAIMTCALICQRYFDAPLRARLKPYVLGLGYCAAAGLRSTGKGI